MSEQRQPSVVGTVGSGGELHQSHRPESDTSAVTTNHGLPVADSQNILKAGPAGPALLEDFIFREKIFHFDHERIPERVVHARGSGAHGYFQLDHPIPELCAADLFQRKGEKTPVFARFSTVVGGAGSADTPRDVRGFAVKFYTRLGNWDLVGNNIPVFFIQDAIKFPDLVHAVKMESDRGYPQAASAHDTFWDFVSLMPESTHMLLWAMSDRTLPRSLRMMAGFGVHTFRLINRKGKVTLVKFHWRPTLGVQSTLWDEACKLAGADPDFHRRDLYESIARGDFPEWTLGIQAFDEDWAARQPYDVLDPTKLVPEEDVPIQPIGRMVLDRNVDNFFAETEQVAFLPSNVVPGIDFTNDPLLQGRLFSYLDTQKSRLGTTNFFQLPINAPRCPIRNFQRDGLMQTHVPTGRANYEPNTLHVVAEPHGPRDTPSLGFATLPTAPADDPHHAKVRQRPDRFADHFSQARLFFRSQTEIEQSHVVDAFVFELSKVTLPHVRDRVVGNLRNVDADLAKRIASELGTALPRATPPAREPIDMPPSAPLSILANAAPTLRGRSIGIVIDEGSAPDDIDDLTARIKKAGARSVLIAPRLGAIKTGGRQIVPDAHIAATPSVIFDAIAFILTEDATLRLAGDDRAIQFARDAYVHLKAIGIGQGSEALLAHAGIDVDDGITNIGAAFVAAAARRHFAREAKLRPAS